MKGLILTQQTDAIAARKTPGEKQPENIPPMNAPQPAQGIPISPRTIALALFVLVLALYGRTVGFGFVNYDDNGYVYENPQVVGGLTAANVRWAFEIHGPSMWVPFTWLSHQTVVTLFGMNPAAHHAVNVLLHAANAALLFLVVLRYTSQMRRAALVAVIFAMHPIHAESVAWVTERKDVLSLFFCLLTLRAWHAYTTRGGLWRYALVALLHFLAVGAKPLAVTMPLLLFLVDWWPLRRATLRAVWEKIPLLAISALASWLTILCQKSIGAIGSLEAFPIARRLANAAIALATYLRKLVLPNDLAVFYPYPQNIAPLVLAASLVLLGVIVFFAWKKRRTQPVIAFGFAWYVVALIPMIGLVQAGAQSMADRYAYLPAIGIYIAVVWTLDSLLRSPTVRASVVASAATALLLTSRQQVAVWRDSGALFTQALAVTERNYLAENNYGLVQKSAGRLADALEHFQRSLAIRPGYEDASNNLGITLAEMGRLDEAIAALQTAVARSPQHVQAHYNLGRALFQNNALPEAEAALLRTTQLAPTYALAWYDLGNVRSLRSDFTGAIAAFQTAIQLRPDYADAWTNMAYAHSQLQQNKEATAAYERAIAIRPDHPQAAQNLGIMQLAGGQPELAVQSFQKAVAAQPFAASGYARLADSLRATGQYAQATTAYQRALELAPNDAEIHHSYGVHLGALGAHEAARKEFQITLQLQPQHAAAAKNLKAAEAAIAKPPK